MYPSNVGFVFSFNFQAQDVGFLMGGIISFSYPFICILVYFNEIRKITLTF